MSIWVRSQDETILAKMSNFRICEYCVNRKINQYSIDGEVTNGNTYELGVYSTKEKALKVLDKILRAITSQLCDINRVVFQMPQDDEVEA